MGDKYLGKWRPGESENVSNIESVYGRHLKVAAIDGTPAHTYQPSALFYPLGTIPLLTALSLSGTSQHPQLNNEMSGTYKRNSFVLAASHFVFALSLSFFLSLAGRNWRARENGDSGGMKEINMPQYVNDKLPPLSWLKGKVKYVQVLLLTLPVNKYYLSDTKKWHSIIQQMFSAALAQCCKCLDKWSQFPPPPASSRGRGRERERECVGRGTVAGLPRIMCNKWNVRA